MSVNTQIVRFSDIQSIIIDIQTCHVHRPIIVGMYDHQYHLNLNVTNHESDACDINTDIDDEYFISSVSFQSSHNKFRFAVERVSGYNCSDNKCCICGFKIGDDINDP